MITRSPPRYLWPIDHQRTSEPIGHRHENTHKVQIEQQREYPECVKCGAWILSVFCEFCGTKRNTHNNP